VIVDWLSMTQISRQCLAGCLHASLELPKDLSMCHDDMLVVGNVELNLAAVLHNPAGVLSECHTSPVHSSVMCSSDCNTYCSAYHTQSQKAIKLRFPRIRRCSLCCQTLLLHLGDLCLGCLLERRSSAPCLSPQPAVSNHIWACK